MATDAHNSANFIIQRYCRSLLLPTGTNDYLIEPASIAS